ncbi:MAG TPA: acyltransferase [Terriglobales bacterium]
MLQPLHQTTSDAREGLFSRALSKLNTIWVSSTYPFARKGRNLSLHYASEISRLLASHVELGNRVVIGKHSWFHTWVDPDMKHQIKIILEDDCHISSRCTITAKNLIRIGRGAVLSSDVLVMDHGHAYENIDQPIKDQGATRGGQIHIGEGCSIGRGAAILCDKGELVLGPGCVVAPGSVVTRSFPANSRIAGNPASLVRESAPPNTGNNGPNGNHDSNAKHTTAILHSKLTPADENRAAKNAVSEDPINWLSRTLTKVRTQWLVWTYPFAQFGKASWAHYSFRMYRSAARCVSLGDSVGLARDSRLEVTVPSGTEPAALVIENGSGLQRRDVIRVRNGIQIKKDVIFGPSVLVADHVADSPKHKSQPATILIQEDCWIGFGAVIAAEHGDLVIGRHSVVGANTIVTRSIPPYSVVAGNPARIVKQYDFPKGKWVLGCVRPIDATNEKTEIPLEYSLTTK